MVVSGTFKTYYVNLKKNLQYLCSRLQKFRSEQNSLLNRSKQYHSFQVGQLVYMYKAKGIIIHTGSRKIACYFDNPLVIYRAIGPNPVLLMSLTGQIYPFLVEETRLKPGAILPMKGNVHTLAELKQVLSARVKSSSLQEFHLCSFPHHMYKTSLLGLFLAAS